MDRNIAEKPFVIDAQNETISNGTFYAHVSAPDKWPDPPSEHVPTTLFALVQDLDNAMQAYLQVKQVVVEAQLAERTCLEKLDEIQKHIDDWYAEKHLTSPVGSHWRKANGH